MADVWQQVSDYVVENRYTNSTLFRRLDQTRSLFVTWIDLKNVLPTIIPFNPPLTDERARKLIAEVDIDGDGRLDMSELSKHLNGLKRRSTVFSPEKRASVSAEGRTPPGKKSSSSKVNNIAASMLLDIVGQEDIKKQVYAFEKTLRLDLKRDELGKSIYKFKPHHMAFMGNPGTGKTSIARVMATVLKTLGVLSKGHLVEVQRSDLVAGAIGQTGPKTQSKIDEAKGGILFIDEAYRLTSANSEKDFGREALDQLMQSMNDGDPVMIFAGYEKEMKAFIDANPGLFRRIQKQYKFADYSIQDLAKIFCVQLEMCGFTFKGETSGDEVEKTIGQIIEADTFDKQRSRMNAGMVDQIMQLSKEELDSRLDLNAEDLEAQICNFTPEDILKAVATLKTNWLQYESLADDLAKEVGAELPKRESSGKKLAEIGYIDPAMIKTFGALTMKFDGDVQRALEEQSGTRR